MASAPDRTRPVTARVDRGGKLIAAEEELERLQHAAGGELGGLLLLPQLAAIVRLAFRLGVAIERPALLAGPDHDVQTWVRAVPDGEEAILSLDGWTMRPPGGPRFDRSIAGTSGAAPRASSDMSWASDRDLRITELSPDLAGALGVSEESARLLPLTKLVRLVEDDAGEMPIINALAQRHDFAGQSAQSRVDTSVSLTINGEAQTGPGGLFEGFRGTAKLVEVDGRAAVPPARSAAKPISNSSLDDVLRAPIEHIVREAEHISGRSDGPLRSDYAGYGGDIAAAARHLLSVLKAMGDEPEFGRGSIDLAELAAEAVVLVEPIAEERNVTVALEPASAIRASGEEHAIIQILVNLVVNAVRHSPAGGKVHLAFARAERWSSVTVVDHGEGIAAQDQKRIFERFERADDSPGGTGLGLAIARRLARSMGGDVSVESAPGKGARFTLSLPAA